MPEIARRIQLGSGVQTQKFAAKEENYTDELTKILQSASYNGQQIDKWELLDNAYRASGGFQTGEYLIPHPSEQEAKYMRRKNMCYFINYVKPVVDAHVNPIFKNNPIRRNMSNTYEMFCNNVDGKETSITRFMKKAAIRAKLHGVEFIVVDMEYIEEGKVITEKYIEENRLYPYLYIVSPKQINNWATDKFGNLIYISYTIDNSYVNNEGNPVTDSETYVWTKDWCKKVVNGKEITKKNEIGIIPIIPLYGTINDSDTLIPQSDLYAIARTNLALFNACSEYRSRSRAQAFSLLTYPLDAEDDYATGDEPLRYGTADMLLYKANRGSRPEFITPPTDSSDILLNEINFMIKEIYRMANLQLVTGVHQYNVSGIAKEWDNQQLFQTISELAQGLQEAEYKIAKIFTRYMNEDMSDISIMYNNQYGIVDSTSILTEATQALSLNICPEYNKEMKSQVIRATLKDVDNSVIEKVINSLNLLSTAGDGLQDEKDVQLVETYETQ